MNLPEIIKEEEEQLNLYIFKFKYNILHLPIYIFLHAFHIDVLISISSEGRSAKIINIFTVD